MALIEIDELHGTLNGTATKKLCERAWLVYNDERYKRLSRISVSHLYNLRDAYSDEFGHLIRSKSIKDLLNIDQRIWPRSNKIISQLTTLLN